MNHRSAKVLVAGIVGAISLLLAGRVLLARASGSDHPIPANPSAKIIVDYPLEGSIFPPEITPPTFLFRDASDSAKRWMVEVTFADHSSGIRVEASGEHMQLGELDPEAGPPNELTRLTPQQAASRTWKPDADTWSKIKRGSVKSTATITITGFADDDFNQPGIDRQRDHFHVIGSCRRAHFLSRRAPDAVAKNREGQYTTASALRHSLDQVEVAQHR